MNDFGVKSSQIKNILSNFGASTQRNYAHPKTLAARRGPVPFRGGAPRAENPRRRRLRHALRQPRIRQQRLQPVADALQRPPHAPCGRRMAGEEPPRIRRGHATELRPAQRRARTVSERRQTADVLPLLDRERAGRGGYLRPQGADGRLLPCPRQRLGGVLPQPPVGLSGPLRLDAARKDLRGDGYRLGGHVLRGVARNVPHPLGRTLHTRRRILFRIRLLDVPLRRLETRRERDGQP